MTISLSVAALLAAAAFAPMVWHELHDRGILGPDWFRMESIRQVTYNGRTKTAAISPDGRYLAFVVSDPGGFETLYVKQLEPASEQVKIPKRRIEYAGITFSPDSQSIYEVEKDDTLTGKLYRVPLVGDRPNTPIVVDIDGPVSFSPSGTQFAFVRYLPDQQKSVLELGSTSLTPSEPAPVISLHEMTILQRVAWAPKGDVIAAFLFSANGDGMLDLINVKGQESRRMLPAWRTIGQPAWTSNAETLIVPAVLRTEGDTRGQLREISLKDGSIHDVTKDIAGYTSATLTRDGQQLASVRLESKASVWISGPNDFKAGQSASAEVQEQPSLSWSDDSHIVLNLQRSGFPNLWRYDITGGSLATLTNEPYVEQDATYVSGRNLVVFSSNRSGEFHIWTFDAESNKYTQLTFGPGYDEAPSVSPDGKWVVYTSWTGNSPHLYKVSLSGGGAFQIGKRRARHADISPDGKFIACEIQDPGMFVAVIPFDGEGEPQAFRNAQIPVHWLRDGSGLSTVLTDARGVSNIWSIPTNGSPPQQLTRFDEQGIVAFAWSPRGDRLACIRTTSTGDAVILRRQR